MKKKLSCGALFVSALMVAGSVGTAHAAWDTTVVTDVVEEDVVADEIIDLITLDPALDTTGLDTAQVAVLMETLQPSAVATAVSAGAQATGAASAGTTLGRVAKLRSDALYARMQNAPAGPAGPTSSTNVPGATGIWGKAVGTKGDQDAIDGVEGYEFDTAGLVFGYDSQVHQNWLVGVNVGYIASDVDSGYNLTANSDIDSWVAGLYGTYSRGIDYLDFGFSYIKGDISSERKVIQGATTFNVTGDTDSSTYVLFGNLGRNYIYNNQHILTPYLGAQWSTTSVDGYTETGTGALEFEKNDTSLFNTTLGVKYEYVVSDKTSLKARASWAHEWSNDLQSVVKSRFTALGAGGAYFETRGIDVDADRFGFGLGAKFYMAQNVSMDLDYDLEMADEYISHTGSINFRYNF